MDDQAGGEGLEPVGPSVLPSGPGPGRLNLPLFRITIGLAAVVGALGLLLSGTSARAQSRTIREQMCIQEAQFTGGSFGAATSSNSDRDRQQRAFVTAVRRCSNRLRDVPLPSTTSTTEFLVGP